MEPTDATAAAKEIRDRLDVIDTVIPMLPPPVLNNTTALLRGPDQSWVLRGDRGQNLAVIHDRTLAQFTRDAPDHLRALSARIKVLEEAAYRQRRERRAHDRFLKELTEELIAADQFGVHSKDGQRRVRSAVAAAREGPQRNDVDDWDDMPTRRDRLRPSQR